MSPECTRVMDALGAPLPPELASHVASCAGCRALVEGLGALEDTPAAGAAPGPDLERMRRASLAELATHPRATPWGYELGVLLGVYLTMTGVGALALSRVGLFLNAAPPGVVVALGVLVALGMVGGAVVALAPSRHGAWSLVGTSAAVVALAVVLGGSGVAARGFLTGVMGCTRTHLLLSALPLVAAVVMLRRSAFHPARAMAAGLSAGAVGLLLLHMHCPDGTTAHLTVSHVGPWLLLGGVALAVRSRLSTPSHAP